MVLDDLSMVLHWRNHPDIRRWMHSRHEITPDEHARWFANAQGDAATTLLIFERKGDPAGFVRFSCENSSAIAQWGFYIAPEAPHGAGVSLGIAALDHAFGVLNFAKVRGEALVGNERSIRFHRRLGFRHEENLHERLLEDESTCAVLCFGLLAAAWRQHRQLWYENNLTLPSLPEPCR